MADVFDEINDDIRREKLNQFWQENGAWIIGGAIAAVLLTGGMSFWRQWQHQHDVAATSELLRVEQQADVAKLEDFAKTTGKNHAVIARFIAAGIHLDRGEKEQAAALYDQIGGAFGVDRIYRELAKILSVSQRLDRGDPEKLKKELSGLSGDSGYWRYTARELGALLEAKQGHTQRAIEVLTGITSDPQAPEDARARAVKLRELYIAGTPQ